MDDLVRLIYVSQPFGFDDAMFNGILADSRRNNLRDGVTGALICRADLYLQLLEGSALIVEKTFARITRDNRHLEVRRLFSEPVSQRLFEGWAMLDDPARSWMWTQKDVSNGAIERAPRNEMLAVFARVRAEVGHIEDPAATPL